MVVAAAIGWCAAYAGIAHWSGLSYEMGALIAGVSLSSFSTASTLQRKLCPCAISS